MQRHIRALGCGSVGKIGKEGQSAGRPRAVKRVSASLPRDYNCLPIKNLRNSLPIRRSP